MFKSLRSKEIQADFALLEQAAAAQLAREEAMVRALRDRPDELSERERGLVANCWARKTCLGLPVSDAQYQWLCDLCRRLSIEV